jgi:serine/threonine protein kinase
MDAVKQLYGKHWSKREYVIALHYYFRNRHSPCHVDAAYVQEIASLLGRTPAAIAMRMENFASLDTEGRPSHKGLSNGGPLCRELFLHWKNQTDVLAQCADVYIEELKEPRSLSLFEPERVTMPKAFDKYELLDPIGEGGFATVFSCVHVDSGLPFALKILRTPHRWDEEALHRFVREMRILRSVRHEHVIQVHEDNLEKEKSFPGFVMDLADCSLSQYLETRKKESNRDKPYLLPQEAVHIIRSVISAIATLHGHSPRKIIHRDINPNNILLLPDKRWVLADFGLAKFGPAPAFASSFASRTNRGWGTTYYAPPDQYANFTQTDERTDIYALGILIWELFTTAMGWPQMSEPQLPEPLRVIFGRCTALSEKRYVSVSELMTALDEAVNAIWPDVNFLAASAGN